MKDLLTVRDVARFFRRSRRTVDRWIARGKLKTFKIGQTVRIPRAAMDEFIVNNTKYQD